MTINYFENGGRGFSNLEILQHNQIASLKNYFFYNCQKNVTFMHRYQVAKYVIFDSEKIFVKKFPWMLK
jgi:hypothetical protein